MEFALELTFAPEAGRKDAGASRQCCGRGPTGLFDALPLVSVQGRGHQCGLLTVLRSI